MRRIPSFIASVALALTCATALSQTTASASASTPETKPNLTLHGTVTGRDNHTYVSVPFRVPAGVHRLSIAFSYDRANRTTIDLSLYDPERFRGSSGGNKSEFTVADTDATPSYLPGAIIPGQWKLVLGIPNIRPTSTAPYTAKVWFDRASEDRSFTAAPLRIGRAWYRGDLHLHDAHSDGSCASQSGCKVPCPLFFTADAAARRGLDFIAITDHNTQSQANDMRELQPYFDKLLLIPGREITTFHGHMNIWGTTRWVDYRVGTPQVPTIDHVIDAAHALGALVSVNHPEDPTGEDCMGCGWDQSPPANMNHVDAIEIFNGGHEAGFTLWKQQLNAGHRITAVAGSDNHSPPKPLTEPGSVGWPTTVVLADALSVDAILAGIRAGHVVVDIDGSFGPGLHTLDVTAEAAGHHAGIGDTLHAPANTPVTITLDLTGCDDCHPALLLDGVTDLLAGGSAATATWPSDGRRHWLLPEATTPFGRPILIANPIYLNFP